MGINKNDFNITNNITINNQSNAELDKLKAQMEAIRSDSERLTSQLSAARAEASALAEELSSYKHGNGIEILESELERFRNTAEQSTIEFRNFLESVNLNDGWGHNDWQFEGLFDQIRDGSITAAQAITKVKTEFRALMKENYNNAGGLFDSQMVQSFTASMERLGETIGTVLTKIENIEQNGVRAIGEDGSSAGGAGGIADVLKQIEKATAGMSEEAKAAYEPITNLVKSIVEYGNIDSTKILGISQAFRNIADIGTGSYGSKSIENVVYLAKQLQALSSGGGGAIRFDFTGFNDLKVSKASVSNLATYLPQIASVNTSKLEKLSQINLTNFNDIKVSKSSIENISKLTEAIQVLREVKAATVKDNGDSISVDAGEKAVKEASHYKDAARSVKEYYSLLIQLSKSKSDVTLTSEGWVSESGQWNELAAALNRTKTAFDLYTNSANNGNLTSEEQINLLRLVTSESQKYVLSVEQQANKEREAAEAAAAKAQKQQEEAAAKAASTAASQQAKAQAEAEAKAKREAAQAAKDEANAEKERTKAKNDAERASRQVASAENSATMSLTKGEKALKDWTSAEHSVHSSSRTAYKDLREQVNILKDVRQKYINGAASVDDLRDAENGVRTSLKNTENILRANGDATKTWGERIGGLAKKFSTWFSITRVIMGAVRVVKQMINESIELESSLAQLKIVTGATDAEMEKFTDTAFNMAKALGQSVSDVVGSIETFSRLGYSLEEASTLAEYASILSNVAAVDNDEATTGLTSIIKGFNLDVTEAEHVADVLIEVGQKYAVSASEMMEAYERSGAALYATNTSFEKSAGLIAAANAAVQDSSVVGTALKTVSARIRGSKTDLEELGEDTEELANGFSKYAEEIKALSGFDIMVEGSTDEFKDLYDIMEGISAVWGNLSDTQQSRIAEILGGTRQLQVISSIIGNWSDAAGAYTDAMNSAGTATEANDIYMQTAAAHIEQFKASFTELSQQLFSSGFIKFFVDFGTGILEAVTAVSKFIDKVAALKVLLIALVSTIAMTTVLKLVTAGFTKIISLFKHVIQIIPNAISMWKAYAASNTTAAVAEGEAAAGAVTLSAALQASIPVIGLVLAALTLLVGTLAVVSSESEDAGDTLKMEQEQTRSEMQRTADAAVDEANSIIELYEEYYNAAKAANNLTGSLKEYNDARNKLIDGIGLEKSELQKLIDKYGDYNKALAAAAAQKIGYDLIDIQGGIDAASEKLKDLSFADVVGGTGAGTGLTANIILGDRSEEDKQKIIDEVNDVIEILQQLPDGLGFIFNRTNVIIDEETKEVADGIYGFFNNEVTEDEIKAYGDKATAEIIKKYKALREALRLMSENGIESDNPVYKLMYDSYQYIKEDVESYLDYIDKYNAAVAEQSLYTYLSKNEMPETKGQFDALRQSIIDSIVANGQYKGTVNDVEDAVDSLLRKQSAFSGFFDDISSSADDATSSVNSFVNALSKINNLNDGLEQLDKIYADIFNGGDFDYSSILGNTDFVEAFGDLGDSYNEFIETIANSPSDISACQSAFDNLVTAYLLNSGALDKVTDSTRNATVAMLEQMGVSNAAAIVDANLAYQKELLKYTTGDYADMTYEEILQLYNECEAGSVTQQILAELAISKMLVNDNAIKSENDIDQIIALANAANATTESLVKCAEAKALMAKADTYMEYFNSATDPRGKSAAMSQYTYYSNQAKSLLSTGLDYNKIDASQFKASYAGGSNTSSARSSAAKAAEKSASEAAKEETWFEKQYKLHKHLVAMEQEDDEDYYSWLNSAMTQAYNEGILELDDYRKYQEEVFSGLRALFKDYLNDVEHEISMRKNYDGEAKKIISLYKTLISKVEAELQAAYARGLDDTDDYVQELLSKWQGYKDGIKDIQDDIEDNAKDAVDDLIDYVQDMQKQEIEDQKDALDKKLDNLKEFYDKQKEMLEDARDEEKYLDEQAEKRKSVTDIQAELARLEYDNSAWAQKRKAELKDELVDAQKELDEFEKDRALDLALDAIEESYNAQEAQIQAEMDALDAELNNPELMFNKALAAIQTNTGNLYQQMLEFNRKYGTGNDEDVKDKYEEAYKALLEYKKLNGKDYNGVTLTNATGYKSETGSYDSSKPKASTPTTTTTPKSTTPTTTTTPTLDDATKRKVAAAIWNGGYGWGTGSTRSSRLTEVFGANNGIQALVNKNVGRYDSAPGNSYTYLNMRKKFKGYASGTKNALAGLAQINELGDEAIFQSKDGNTYKLFSGGEKVLNAKATDFLYEFANGGSEILEKVIKSALGGGLFDKISPIINNNEVNMGDIIVQGSATSQTVSEIRREQREAVKYMLTEFQKLNK